MAPMTRSRARKSCPVTQTSRSSNNTSANSPTRANSRVEVSLPKRLDVPNVSAWPTLSTLTSLSDSVVSVESYKPKTPKRRPSWNAGPAILTPKKLKRSPDRIGGHGIDFWKNGSGVVLRGIVDSTGAPQEAYRNTRKSQDDDEGGGQSSMGGHRGLEQMKMMKEDLEAVGVFHANKPKVGQSDDTQSTSVGDEFNSGHQVKRQRLGPEGTILISDYASSCGSDTDMDTDDGAVHSDIGRSSRALGLEPTLIIDQDLHSTSGHHARALGWVPTLIIGDERGQSGAGQSSQPLGWEPTLIIETNETQKHSALRGNPAVQEGRSAKKPLELQTPELVLY